MPRKDRRKLGGRDYQALIDQARERLNEITRSLRELQDPTLLAKYKPVWGNRGEQAINDLHQFLLELEQIGRYYKRTRLTVDRDQPCGERGTE